VAVIKSRSGKRVSKFQLAADGSMTLFDHLRELRGRLFKAVLGVFLGAAVGYYFSGHVESFLDAPYCNYQLAQNPAQKLCGFAAAGSPIDAFVVQLKVSLYFGLLISSPIWLYQLWAFIAPGLHKRERRHAYAFAALATPLFAFGAILAHLVVAKSLHLFLGGGNFTVLVDISGYFGFVTKMMLLFGFAFEFPLLIVMLNMVGMVTGRKLLGWWRPAIFLMFLFGAIVTPTPDPFSMSILAGCMAVLYFAAVGFALINDRRRGRTKQYADLDDDDVSPLDDADNGDPIEAGAFIHVPEPIEPAQPLPRSFDDFT
jgi:sec-independent protein translocase protein TatC